MSSVFLFLFFCFPSLTKGMRGHFNDESSVVRVIVVEDEDAILPCLLSTKKDITATVFDWRKDGLEVFMYDKGLHYNEGRQGQDEQFKGRVIHFPGQLKHGNASIMIRKTKISDNGTYTCDFPNLQPSRQTIHIELVVQPVFKDRSQEIRRGATPEPYIRTLKATKDQALLLCDVRGASPKPEVEWQDSAGNILPAEEPWVSYRGDRYYITLNTTVTKTDNYRCVVTQEEIHHKIAAETYVHIIETRCEDWAGWLFGGLVFGASIPTAALALLVFTKSITISRNKGSPQMIRGSCNRSPSETSLMSDV